MFLMQNLKKRMKTNPPKTIEEFVVSTIAIESRCTETLLFPPPQTCPRAIQIATMVASWHIMTVIFVVMGILAFFKLTFEKKE